MYPIGTRIKFTQYLDDPADGDHPHFVYAEPGQTGIIVAPPPGMRQAREGYWVKTDNWPHPFGASEREFKVIE